MVSRLNEIRDGKATWKDIAGEVMSVSPDPSVNTLVDQLQEERQVMALVIEEGRVREMVTSTDAVETVAEERRDPPHGSGLAGIGWGPPRENAFVKGDGKHSILIELNILS